MPHIVLEGPPDLPSIATGIQTGPRRWGRAVLKTEAWWMRSDAHSVLVEGVIVEFSRALHPLAVITPHHGDTAIRLWPYLEIERTPALQRWLGLIGADLQRAGAGSLKKTNIPNEFLEGVEFT